MRLREWIRSVIIAKNDSSELSEIRLRNKHFPGWAASDPSGKRKQSRKKGTENALRDGPQKQQWGDFFLAGSTKFYPENFGSEPGGIGSIVLPDQTSLKILAQDYNTVDSDNAAFDQMGTDFRKKVLKVQIQSLPPGSKSSASINLLML